MAQNFKRMIMDVFAGNDPGGVVWQPRIDFWYQVNQKRGTLPPYLKDASLIDVYDYCHASIRYFNFPLRIRYRNTHTREAWEGDNRLRRIWETPIGELTEVLHHDELRLSGFNTEYVLKNAQDFKIHEYILQDEEWYWDEDGYAANEERVGDRGVTHFFSRRSPLQNLFIDSMGFEKTILFMTDYPDVVQHHMEVQTEADDALYRLICDHRVPIFNMGDNIDHHMDPPAIWKKSLQPYYQLRCEQMHAAGIHTSLHVDGSMKRILREIQASPLESIEACTPLPQGDVTLDEIKQAIGDRILLDGIPAIFFLPMYPLEELKTCMEEVVRLFHPRLILGVSDELPPDSDIERVRMVGEWVQEISL